jgi:hypothetical protein
MKGSDSPACCMTKCRLHFCEILMKVSHAMSCTPDTSVIDVINFYFKVVTCLPLTFMSLVHELEKLVDDSLEELPVGFEESRVLANDVHDVGGADRLVVLSTLLLGQAEEILDDRNQETLLHLLAWRKRQRGRISVRGLRI